MIANLKGIEMACPDNTAHIIYDKALWVRQDKTDQFKLVPGVVHIPPPMIILLDRHSFKIDRVPDTEELISYDGEIYEFVRMSPKGEYLYGMISEPTAIEDLVCS
jgi:hypothetical protein